MGYVDKFGKYPADALVEFTYKKKHWPFEKGQIRQVHPNTAIMLREKGYGDFESDVREIEVKEPRAVTTKSVQLNANDTITEIGKVETLDALKKFDGDDRVTVQRAYESRLKELK